METFWNILVDAIVGLVTTIVGVLLTFWAFAPKIRFDDNVRSVRRGERIFYRVRLRNAARLPLYNVEVTAYFLVRGPARSTSVPVPLSTGHHQVLRRQRRGSWQTPRLLLDEVNWARHLPATQRALEDPTDLRAVLEAYEARLIVEVSGSSAIFGVTGAKVARYSASQLAEPDDDDQSENQV